MWIPFINGCSLHTQFNWTVLAFVLTLLRIKSYNLNCTKLFIQIIFCLLVLPLCTFLPGYTRAGLDPTNKKSQIQIFFWKYLKILEASSHDQINMTKFWLEHDWKYFTRANVNIRTWPKNLRQTLTIEHDQKYIYNLLFQSSSFYLFGCPVLV